MSLNQEDFFFGVCGERVMQQNLFLCMSIMLLWLVVVIGLLNCQIFLGLLLGYMHSLGSL
jgi:hypothetical protein